MKPVDKAELQARASLVIRDYRGMIPFHEVFYLQSILYAADRSHAAFKRFDAALAENAADAMIFALMQEAMTHAGALSRFFWPMKTKNDELAQARGRKLREAFGLTDASPLRERRLRNAFEHFDEDLDHYLLEHETGTFFPDPRVDDHTLADEATGRIFKLVDPTAGICVLLGQKFLYQPIREEIERVLGLAGGAGTDGRLPGGGEARRVDADQAFTQFHAKWSRRLGLKRQYLEESFARGRDSSWAHNYPDELPHTPGHTRILISLEGANLLGSIEPAWLDDMVREWAEALAGRDGDLRKLTRQFITESMALNRHQGDAADLLLSAATWLIVTKDDSRELVTLMRRGDIEVQYEISFENDTQQTRFRLSMRECK